MMYHCRNPVKFRSHLPKKRCKMRGSRIYIQDIPLKSPASPTRKQGAESGRSRFLRRFAPFRRALFQSGIKLAGLSQARAGGGMLIGRAAWRARVCDHVWIAVMSGALKKKEKGT